MTGSFKKNKKEKVIIAVHAPPFTSICIYPWEYYATVFNNDKMQNVFSLPALSTTMD